MKGLIAILICFCVLNLFGAAGTFYIDWTGGADANNGTSTASAWKRHPYMTNFTGSYSHTAGDCFVFKGGEIWPTNNCFRMRITAGGSGSGVYDRYRSTNNWFSGAAWTNPVFNAGGPYGGFGAAVSAVQINDGVKWIVWEDIDFARYRNDAATGPNSTVIQRGASGEIIYSGCRWYEWGLTFTPTDNQDTPGMGGGLTHETGSSNADGATVVSNCLFTQNFGSPSGQPRTGWPIFAIGNGLVVHSTTFSNASAGVNGGGNFTNSIWRKITTPTDPQAHTDIVTTGSRLHVDSCLVVDCNIGAGLQSQSLSGTHSNWIVNSVFKGNTFAPVEIFTGAANIGVFMVNCTSDSELTLYISAHGGVSINYVEARNDNFIISGSTPFSYAGLVNTTLFANNLTNTIAVAASYGATEANYYEPTSGAPINTGVDLSALYTTSRNGVTRPQLGAFDIGAYEAASTNATVVLPGIANVRAVTAEKKQ